MNSSFLFNLIGQNDYAFAFLAILLLCVAFIAISCFVFAAVPQESRQFFTDARVFRILRVSSPLLIICLCSLVILGDRYLFQQEIDKANLSNSLMSTRDRLGRMQREHESLTSLLDDFVVGFLNESRNNSEIIKFQEDLIQRIAAPVQTEAYGPPAPESAPK